MLAYKVVGLDNSLSYNTTVSFKNKRLTLTFNWNERLECRTLSIKDTSGNVILRSKALLPNCEIELSSNALLLGYNAKVHLVEKYNGTGDLKNWANKYDLIIFEE